MFFQLLHLVVLWGSSASAQITANTQIAGLNGFTEIAKIAVNSSYNYDEKLPYVTFQISDFATSEPRRHKEKRDTNHWPLPDIKRHPVFAHFMLGNTEHYSKESFRFDVKNAKKLNIDGFTINYGCDRSWNKNCDTWMITRLAQLYEVAEEEKDFYLYLNFDMNVLPCKSATDANLIVDLVDKHFLSPIQARGGFRAMVGTFLGNACTFGEQNPSDGWEKHVREPLAAKGKQILFIPFFPERPDQIMDKFPKTDGFFKWNAWPYNVNEPNSMDEDIMLSTLCQQKNKKYMASISPWFFTHYEWKNWIYRSEDLWALRWEQMIFLTPDMLQIVSWNDYGESHYIGPVNPDASYAPDKYRDASAWTKGYDHKGFAAQLPYYIKSYKDGDFYTPEKNSIALYFRTSSKNVNKDDPVPKPKNWDFAIDSYVINAILKEPTDINFTTSSNKTLTIPLKAGVSMTAIAFDTETIGKVSLTTLKNTGCKISMGPFNKLTNSTSHMYNFNAVSDFCEF